MENTNKSVELIPFRDLWRELYPSMQEMRFGSEMMDEAAEIIDAVRKEETEWDKCVQKCHDRLYDYNHRIEIEEQENGY